MIVFFFVIFSGRHHLKKLGKQNSFGNINDEKLPENAKHKLSIAHKPKAKKNESYALLSKKYKLKNKNKKNIWKHKVTNNNLISSRVPKASFVRLPAGVSADSDEIVSEANASTQSNLKDEVLLETLMTNETDSDSNQPITDESEEGEKEDDSVPGHVRGDVHQVSDKERPEDTEEEQVHKDEHETEESPKGDNDNDVDDDEDEDREPEEDNNDNDSNDVEDEKKKNPAPKIENQEQLKKMRHDEKQNITPYEISDQMSHDLTRIYGGIEDHTAAMMDQERHVEALNKLRAYSAQIKQQMLQRLRLSYENTIGPNAALVPQYYMPQPPSIPEVPVKAPSLLDNALPVYRPAIVDPPRRASSLTQSGSQGYSINVDGLHGVFSKSPGYVVRFHSPDSEVTVVKKQYVVDPMTETRAWQVDIV